MKKWLLLLFMLFTATGAFANDPNVLHPDAVSQYTDMSIFYLSQIFGTVGSVLTGGHTQLMGKLFYILNWGIFSISGVLISYTVFLSTMKMATEGVTIQPGRSTVYNLLKLAIGVSLVIPSAATGYSVIQEVVMKTVIQGVGLADSVWNSALTYLENGGTVFSIPNSMTPYNNVNSDSDPDKQSTYNSHYDAIENVANTNKLFGATQSPVASPTTAFAAAIFQNEVCMIGSRDLGNSGNGATPYFTPQIDINKQQIRFPGLNDSDLNGSGCGTASWSLPILAVHPDNTKGASSNDLTLKNTDSSTIQAAVIGLVNDMLPLAKQFYCKQYGNANFPNGATCSGITKPHQQYGYAPTLFNAALNYFSAVQILADQQRNAASDAEKTMLTTAKREGWIMAGRYYWDIMNKTGTSTTNENLTAYIPDNIMPAKGDSAPDAAFKSVINSAGPALSNNYQQYFKSYKESVLKNTNSTNDDATKGADKGSDYIISPGTAAGITAAGFPLAPAWIAVIAHINKIGSLFNMQSSTGIKNHNPIVFLNAIGQQLLAITECIWMIGAICMAVVGATAIMSCSSPYYFFLKGWADWIKPILMTLAMLCLGAGFFLCYYVPIYPYMIFLFATIGWLVSVIEAMVAAPIVALGMAHPENHDFLGKAEQGLMLLLGIFMQPALLVIGMIAGIIFSYISFELLIYTFSGLMSDLLGSSATTHFSNNLLGVINDSPLASQSNMVTIFLTPLILIIFCSIVYTLLTQSFSLIYVLRDNVMRWIGVPQSGLSNPGQLAEQTRSVAGTFGSQLGKASTEAMGNSGHEHLTGQIAKDNAEARKNASSVSSS